MKIIITVVDAPQGFEPHGLLRNMTQNAQYHAHSLKSISFTESGAQIDMEPCMHPAHDEGASGTSAVMAPDRG